LIDEVDALLEAITLMKVISGMNVHAHFFINRKILKRQSVWEVLSYLKKIFLYNGNDRIKREMRG